MSVVAKAGVQFLPLGDEERLYEFSGLSNGERRRGLSGADRTCHTMTRSPGAISLAVDHIVEIVGAKMRQRLKCVGRRCKDLANHGL